MFSFPALLGTAIQTGEPHGVFDALPAEELKQAIARMIVSNGIDFVSSQQRGGDASRFFRHAPGGLQFFDNLIFGSLRRTFTGTAAGIGSKVSPQSSWTLTPRLWMSVADQTFQKIRLHDCKGDAFTADVADQASD